MDRAADHPEADDLTLTAFDAALFAAAALTGMRSSELMELTGDSCLPPEEVTPGLFRYRLASQLIKGQPWGGTADEWVVIEPAYRAVELAIRLTRAKTWLAAPQSRESLFGRCNRESGSARSGGGLTARPAPGWDWSRSRTATSPAG